MSVLELLGMSFAVVMVYMTIIWIVSLIKKDASIVDIFWGLGFVVVGVAYLILTDGFLPRRLLITALVVVWGLRLSIHILIRNWGKGEDFRYRAWREEAGEKFWWTSFFKVFVLQGVLMWIISAPLLAAQFNTTPAHFTLVDLFGALVWGLGFFFEAVGDWQLTRFRRDPANKGKVLDRGLWRYTRHPNYFGDATLWWGYFIIAAGTPLGFLTVFSPIIMTILLMRVSGVTLLEKTLVETKPGYKEYVERTSAFFPLPPRRKVES